MLRLRVFFLLGTLALSGSEKAPSGDEGFSAPRVTITQGAGRWQLEFTSQGPEVDYRLERLTPSGWMDTHLFFARTASGFPVRVWWRYGDATVIVRIKACVGGCAQKRRSVPGRVFFWTNAR